MYIDRSQTSTIVFLILHVRISDSSISTKKCDEYADAVFELQERPTLAMKPMFIKVSTCVVNSVPLIVGGTEAQEREFPHMAIIGYEESPGSAIEWKCGGSLISDQHVLTAAHCTSGGHSPKLVRLGVVHLNDNGEYMQERKINEIIIHPEFNAKVKYNDIAIMVLDSPVKFTANIRPACLDTSTESNISHAVATGFGTLSFDDHAMSSKLMKVSLDIISNDKCSEYIDDPHGLPQNVTSSMLCAGVLAGGKDTCSGDSGGPLQILLEKPYCMYSILGVTSFGRFCGYAYSPAVYTRLSYYIPWIEHTVWGYNEDI